MHRHAVLGFVVVLALGMMGILAVGLTRESNLVYALGAAPAAASLNLEPGSVACQGPIAVPDAAAFDRVTFTLGGGAARPEITVSVREVQTGRRLGSGTLPAGIGGTAPAAHVVKVGRIASGAELEVCLRNGGPQVAAIYGQPAVASPRTSATVAGKPVAADMAITLNRESRSLIALLPTMLARASVFRAGWVGSFTYVVLGLLVLIAAPVLLARGIARAAAEDSA